MSTCFTARAESMAQVLLASAPFSVRQAWGEAQFASSQLRWVLHTILSTPRRLHTATLRGLLRRLVLPSSLALPLSAATVDVAALGRALASDGVTGFTSATASGRDRARSASEAFGVRVGRLSPRRSYVVDADSVRGSVRAVVGFSSSVSVLAFAAESSSVLVSWVHSYMANVINALWTKEPGVHAWLPRYDLAPVNVRWRTTRTDGVQVCALLCVCVCE